MVSAALYSCPRPYCSLPQDGCSHLQLFMPLAQGNLRAPSYNVIASIVYLFIVPMHMIVGSCTSSWQLAFTPIYTAPPCFFCLTCGSRFGGILLHSDRFKHINNVARILLQESGVGQKVGSSEVIFAISMNFIVSCACSTRSRPWQR